MMKAIVVPGVTDLNKGDQALVWESVRLIQETRLYNTIKILNNGDTPQEKNRLCSQSQQAGFNLIDNILKHPRRGIHKNEESIKESIPSIFQQIIYAILDLISRSFLLMICTNYHAVKIFYSSSVFETIEEFKNANTIFVKGGGFIHAHGEKTAPYIIWFSLFYIRLANRLKKDVIILPNSYGPFRGFTVKYQIKKVLKKSKLIYAREQISANFLKSLLKKPIPVEKDLGFFLKIGDKDKSSNLLHQYGIENTGRLIGLTVRPWRFPGLKDPEKQYENYIESIKSFIRYLIEQNYIIIFCNQSLGPNAHEDDRNAIRKIYSEFKDNTNVVWIDKNLPCDELKTLYSNFNFFIGTRFHSVIFATTSIVPSIAIAYGGNKAQGIMNDYGLNKYVIPIESLSTRRLRESFESMVNNNEEIKRKLRDNLKFSQLSRERIINDIKSRYRE